MDMQRRFFTLIAMTALAVGLAACGSSSKSSSPPASNSTAQITIDNSSGFTFHTTPVKAGSTVTVKNDSTLPRTPSRQDGGGFNVTIDAGKTATFTAPATAGTYKFHCNIHNFMKGTLTVT